MKKSNEQLTILILVLLAATSSAGSLGFAKNVKELSSRLTTPAEPKLPLITRETLREKFGKITLVNALETKYFDRSRIKGSVNIPYDDAGQLATKLLPNKKAEIVVYCMDTK